MKLAILNATSRTANHIISQGLEQGHEIHAAVRSVSAERFKKSHRGKSIIVHEFDDFNNVDQVYKLVKDVDCIFIVASPTDNKLTFLVEHIVHTVVAALRRKSGASRCTTRVILLTSTTVSPFVRNEKRVFQKIIFHIMRNYLNYEPYNDLQRADEYLKKQSDWLDFIIFNPGMLIDPASDANQRSATSAYSLSTNTVSDGAITYKMLAHAMLSTASGKEELIGKNVHPIVDVQPKVEFQDLDSLKKLISDFSKDVFKTITIAFILVAFGYFFGRIGTATKN
ncbi:averufin oxidase-like protein [Acrasis kona]|uniref:Averufin oxidase-like protein n=1 Tax=Acrasis kona TaxID=1008807 RepID=A0AAW2ZKW5_9EUKA